MAICRYFEQGTCRFGNNCKNEHITPNQSNAGRGRGGFAGGFNNLNSGRGGFGNFAGNRGGFANNAARNPFQQRNGTTRSNRPRERWTIDTRIIQTDLTAERPVWPFSCYAPRNDAPRQLIEGKLEISAEEMRLEAYKLQSQGKGSEITQIEAAGAAEMQKSIQQILADLNGAVKYIADGRDVHPNRYDIEDGIETAQSAAQAASSLGAATSPFGQASASSNPFDKNNGTTVTNPFGEAKSAMRFGQPSNSPFASAMASQQPVNVAPNPFGQAGQIQPSNAFGQPSMLGQAKANPFGPSGMSNLQPVANPSPFGSQTTSSPFGQLQAKSPFEQSQTSTADAMMDSPVAKTSPFGGGVQPFGQAQTQAAPSPFGQSGFASQSKPNPFGQQQPQSTTTPAPSTGPLANPFGPSNPAQSSPFTAATQQPASSTFGPSARVTNGSSGAATSRAIFDKGIPSQPHVDDPPQAAYGEKEATFKAAYDFAKEHGSFENNVMPMLPPKIAWISYHKL